MIASSSEVKAYFHLLRLLLWKIQVLSVSGLHRNYILENSQVSNEKKGQTVV